MARSFNGSSDTILLPAGFNSLLPTTALTVSIWVYPSLASAYSPSWGLVSASNNAGLKLYIKSNGKIALYSTGSTTYDGSGTATLSANTWYHLAATHGSGLHPIGFVNGVLDGTDTSTTGLNWVTPTSNIGTDTGNFFSGTLGEAGAWDVILDAGELAALAKGYSPLLVRPGSLFAYLPIIGKASPEIEIINSNSGTLTGTTAAAHPRIIMPSGPGIGHNSAPAASGGGPVLIGGRLIV